MTELASHGVRFENVRVHRSASASVARGALALLSTQPLTWAATLLTTALLPRYLGDQGFGQYSIALTAATLVTTVAALGVPNFLVRHVAARPDRAVADGGAALILLLGAGLVCAALAVVGLPRLGFSSVGQLLLAASLASMVVTTAQRVLTSILNGQERHARFAWFNAAGVVAGALVGVALLIAGGGAVGFFVGSLLATGVMLAIGWRAAGLHLERTAFDVRAWRRLTVGGLPFLLWNITIQIRNQVDILIVAALLSQQAAGWLSAAYRVIFIPMFLPTVIITPLLPVLSRSLGDRQVFDQTLRRSLLTVLGLTVPASAMTMALAPGIPGLLHWDTAFDHSIPLMMVLAFDQPLGAVDMVLGTALFALRQERRWLAVAIVAAVFNPSMNLVFIPLFEQLLHNGALGAACVEVVTETLMFAGALLLLPRGSIGRATLWTGARVIISGACLAAVVMPLQTVWLPLAILAGSVTYLGSAILLRWLRPVDIWAARRFVPQVSLQRGAMPS